MDWNVEEEAKGHMSCCTLKELTEKLDFLPEIDGVYSDDKDLLGENGGSNEPGAPGEPTTDAGA